MIGKIINNILIIDDYQKIYTTGKSSNRYLKLKCLDCNSIFEKRYNRFNNTTECKCKKNKNNTFGYSKDGLYKIYRGIINRTTNPNHCAYKNYGARGIKICEEWFNDFTLFYQWSINNGYIKGLTIERINNDKGYFPDNCCWITRNQQQTNKRNNHLVTYKGITKTISEWAREYNIKFNTLSYRINKGWSIEKSLNTKTFYNKKTKGDVYIAKVGN